MAKDEGVAERVRLSRFRAGLYPAAVLPRHRAVPLGRAVGRSRGHLQHRREGERAAARRSRICTTGSTWRASASRSRDCRRASAGLAWASAIGSAWLSTKWSRSGELKAPIVIGRDHLDYRLGRVAQPRDRSDAGRLGRRLRLAAAECAAELRAAARPGCRCITAAASAWAIRQHAGMVIVCDGTRSRRAPHRPRAVERSGHRRHAPCRCRLRARAAHGGGGRAQAADARAVTPRGQGAQVAITGPSGRTPGSPPCAPGEVLLG